MTPQVNEVPIGWRAWDDEGNHWISTENLPEELSHTIQIVAQYFSTGRRAFHKGGGIKEDGTEIDRWYVLRNGIVISEEGDYPDVMARHVGHTIRRGTWTSDENFNAIYKAAWAENFDGSQRVYNEPGSKTAGRVFIDELAGGCCD